MSIVVTILGTPVLWPTQGDTNYSNGTTQFVQLVESALEPIADLYNGTTGNVGAIQLSNSDTLTYTVNGGSPIAIGGGSVTSVGLSSSTLSVSGSPITTSGTITADLPNSGVTPASYTYASITVDAQGRVTAASSGTAPSLTPPAGGNTEIQFNNSGVFGASSDFKWNGTALAMTGDINVSGTGKRFYADFSNATTANRFAFQSSTANGITNVTAIPNGTSNQAYFHAESDSGLTNTSRLTMGVNAASGFAVVSSSTRGTGTQLPLALNIGNNAKLTIATTGDATFTNNVIVGSGSTSVALTVKGNGAAVAGDLYVNNSDNSAAIRARGGDTTGALNGGDIQIYNKVGTDVMLKLSANTPWDPLDSGICGGMVEGFTSNGLPAFALYWGDGDPTAIAGNGQLTLWEKSGTLQACNIQNNAGEFFGLDTTVPAAPTLNGKDVWFEGGNQTDPARIYLRAPSLNGQMVLRGSSDATGDTTVAINTETVNANAVHLQINTANSGEVQINADVVVSGTITGSKPFTYDEFVATAAQTVFNTTNVTTVAKSGAFAYQQVFVNGVMQQEGASKAYTVTGTNEITFNSGLALNDDVVVYGTN